MLIAAHDIFFVFFIFMNRDGEKIILCSYARCMDADCICNFSSENLSQIAITSKSTSVTLQLRSGLYHERYRDLAEVFFPLVSENILSILMEDPVLWCLCIKHLMLNFETALDVIETAFSRSLCCLAFFIISTLQSFSISFLFNITYTFITLFYLHVLLIICLKRWYFSLILTVYCSQDLSPHLIIAPNAGIAAYPSWLPTIVCHRYS